MNKFLHSLLLAAATLACNYAKATIYTTTASGNFSNSATWQAGNVPPASLANDTINIMSGHNVTLDQDILFAAGSGTALLNVSGSLTSTGTNEVASSVDIVVDVSGSLSLDSMGNRNITMNITGQATITKWSCEAGNITGGGSFLIDEALYVADSLANYPGNTIAIGGMAHLRLSGRLIIGGNIALPGATYYDVTYTSASNIPAGAELSGIALRNITVNMSNNAQVVLKDNLDVASGKLSVLTGVLNLNGNNLAITNSGDVVFGAGGAIMCNSTSDITISNTAGITGRMNFTQGSAVSTFTQNPANGATTRIISNLRVAKEVVLTNGKIEMVDSALKLVTGAIIKGADANRYIITTGSGNVSADIGANNTFAYHIGTAAQYAPCVVTSNNGTIYNGLNARIANGVKSMATTGNDMATKQPMVNTTWFLQHNGSTVDVNVELAWGNSMEVGGFDRSIAYISNYAINYWDKLPGKPSYSGPSGLNAARRDNLTTLGAFAIFDNNTVGVKNIVNQSVINIYPNPATTLLTVAVQQPAQANIYNLSGQPMSSTAIAPGNNSINIAHLPQGMYYIQLTGEGVNGTAKFVKQ